jgi:DNA invertase Pin-like site-specific DNA recombinase
MITESTDVVIYARYSSHNQNETSIEEQLKVCYDFCKRNNYTVIHEYIDRALTGTSDTLLNQKTNTFCLSASIVLTYWF